MNFAIHSFYRFLVIFISWLLINGINETNDMHKIPRSGYSSGKCKYTVCSLKDIYIYISNEIRLEGEDNRLIALSCVDNIEY